jgi:GR25 family glycosyltransferase involved in LPS biosynthesis
MTVKFYVLRKKDDALSEKLSDECTLSAKERGIEVEKFDALYGNDGLEFLSQHGLETFKLPDGNRHILAVQRKCVFASHYKLWLRCLDENKTIGILEHDALFLRSIPVKIEMLFDDVFYLDFFSRPFMNGKILSGFFWKHPKKYTDMVNGYGREMQIKQFHGYSDINKQKKLPTLEDISSNYIRGVHAYMIKPDGARKLIDAADRYGYLTSDAHINPFYVNIHTCNPSIARINQFFCNENNFRKNSHCEVNRDAG